MNIEKFAPCPICSIFPLIVEWEKGTFDFHCSYCLSPLDPSAETLIATLNVREQQKKY